MRTISDSRKTCAAGKTGKGPSAAGGPIPVKSQSGVLSSPSGAPHDHDSIPSPPCQAESAHGGPLPPIPAAAGGPDGRNASLSRKDSGFVTHPEPPPCLGGASEEGFARVRGEGFLGARWGQAPPGRRHNMGQPRRLTPPLPSGRVHEDRYKSTSREAAR